MFALIKLQSVRRWNRLFSDRCQLTREHEVLLDMCSPLRPPGDSVAAQVLAGGQAGGGKWAYCTWGRHCGSLTILADTWEKQIDDRRITLFCHFKGWQSMQSYTEVDLDGNFRNQVEKRKFKQPNSYKQGWTDRDTGYVHRSKVLVIQVQKCQSERQANRSKRLLSMSHLRCRAKTGLSCSKHAQTCKDAGTGIGN